MTPEWRERLLAQSGAANEYVCRRLRDMGIQVRSINEIVDSKADLRKAVPTLVALLEDPNLQDNAIYSGVVRALRDPAARGVAVEPLIREFKRHAHEWPQLGSAIALSIAYTAENRHADALIDLMRDNSYGWARSGLPDGLRSLERDRLVRECRWMLRDPQLAADTLRVIRKRALIELLEEVRAIRHAVGQATSDVRAQAKLALAKLEKAQRTESSS